VISGPDEGVARAGGELSCSGHRARCISGRVPQRSGKSALGRSTPSFGSNEPDL